MGVSKWVVVFCVVAFSMAWIQSFNPTTPYSGGLTNSSSMNSNIANQTGWTGYSTYYNNFSYTTFLNNVFLGGQGFNVTSPSFAGVVLMMTGAIIAVTSTLFGGSFSPAGGTVGTFPNPYLIFIGAAMFLTGLGLQVSAFISNWGLPFGLDTLFTAVMTLMVLFWVWFQWYAQKPAA